MWACGNGTVGSKCFSYLIQRGACTSAAVTCECERSHIFRWGSRRQGHALAQVVLQAEVDGVCCDVGQVYHPLDWDPLHVGQQGLELEGCLLL